MRLSKNAIVFFDFDKTLVAKDSFRIYVFLLAKGLLDKLFIITLTLFCRAGIVTNTQYKSILLKRLWLRLTHKERENLIAKVCLALSSIIIPKTKEALLQHIREGDEVVIVSAAPELYLIPFIHAISKNIKVYGTKIHEDAKSLVLDNLFQTRKMDVARTAIHNSKHAQRVVVYTDHIDDLPLLSLATSAVLVHPSRGLAKAASRLDIPVTIIK